MNYKKVLIEEAAKQFRKEGATVVVITLYDKTNDKVIRDVEVNLSEEDRYFAIAGRTPLAEAAMSTRFLGHTVNGEKWFPFDCAYGSYKPEDIVKLLQQIAMIAGIESSHLKWSYMNDH